MLLNFCLLFSRSSDVYNVVLVFGGGGGEAGLSQEPRRVKGKLFFLPNTHKAKYAV